MVKLAIALAAAIVLTACPSPTPALQHTAETFRTHALHSLPPNSTAVDIATDAHGNTYVCGTSYPTRAHDASPQLFVARLAPDATLVWWTAPFNLSSRAAAITLHDRRLFVAASAVFPHDRLPDAVVLALHSATGMPAWQAPRRFGGRGADAVRALLVDPSASPPTLYVAGHVSGRIFDDGNSTMDGLVHSAAPVFHRHFPPDRSDTADAFVLSLNVRNGHVVAAVQLPLNHPNSADALALHADSLFVAVNTGDVFSLCQGDVESRAAVYEFRTPDLTYSRVRLHAPAHRKGEQFVSLALDGLDALYVGACRQEQHGVMAELRKFELPSRQGVWYHSLGVLPSFQRLCVRLAPYSRNILVSGFVGRELKKRGEQTSTFLELPFWMFDSRGFRVMAWTRGVQVAKRLVGISAFVVGLNDDVSFAGGWKEGEHGLWIPSVGSFGVPDVTHLSEVDTISGVGSAQSLVLLMRQTYQQVSPTAMSIIAVTFLIFALVGLFVFMFWRFSCIPQFGLTKSGSFVSDHEDAEAQVMLFNRSTIKRRFDSRRRAASMAVGQGAGGFFSQKFNRTLSEPGGSATPM